LTGVAGPDPQDGHPVGTLHIGVAGPSGEAVVTSVTLTGDRAAIRTGAVENALTVLQQRVAHAE
jgi:nicotinamide-nucleotide amidase